VIASLGEVELRNDFVIDHKRHSLPASRAFLYSISAVMCGNDILKQHFKNGDHTLIKSGRGGGLLMAMALS
jgi:hypothetical protein